MTQLHTCFAHVRQGRRQIVFVTGDVGLGKTTLVETFVHHLGTEAGLWVGRGQCIEHYGAGEAYLPVLEALGRLCRAPEGAALLPVLEQHAPTWLAQMPALLSAAALEALQRRVLGATQERMLREFAEAVEVLTVSRPLLLVLEDLHWSDDATLDLLTYLARRPGPARLLLLGTYRPVEALLRGHPVKTVKQDLVLHGQGVELPLALLTAAEVAQYLARRGAGGAELPPALRGLAQLLYQRTDGHPLALVTMVEHLRHRGVLRERAGPWEVQPEAAAVLREVPTSVRQMIEQQFDRLSPEEQRVLEAASVAGSACTVAAVAAGLDCAMEAVEDCCAGLAQRGQFLVASGLETWPDGTVTERYGWPHALYQEVVYAQVPEGRRLRLHRRIGLREEAGYGVQAREHAAELAMHFERGQDYRRAVHYLQQAAANALQHYAYREAVPHLTTAGALLATLPDTPEHTRQELALQLTLGQVLFAIKGQGAPEVAQAYERARILCQQVEKTAQLGTVLVGLRMWYSARAEHPVAHELSERLLHLAQHVQEPALLLEAHRSMGVTWFFQGELARARTHLEQGIALATASPTPVLPGDRPASAPGMLPVVGCHVYAAWVLWALGYADQALQRGQEALGLAQALAHPLSEATARYLLSIFYLLRGEGPAAQQQAEVSLRLASEYDVADRAAQPHILRAAALVLQGQTATGIAELTAGLAATRAIGDVVFLPYFLSLLAAAYGHAGQPHAGLQVLAEAHTLVEQSGEHWWQAELHRLQGELLLQQDVANAAQAAICFQQALALTRRQEAKSLELRAAMSLSHLWQQQGKRTEAYALLAPIYGWFTEGFDTADLQEAKALLDTP